MKKVILLLFLLISYVQVNSQDFISKNRYAGDTLLILFIIGGELNTDTGVQQKKG
jgi:hypothetical protein